MKVCLISDIHFGVRKNSEIYLNSQLKFLKNDFKQYLLDNDIEHIFFLGDIFDNRSSINTKILNNVYDLFENDLKDFKIYIIVGNHDTYFTSSIDVNSLKFLAKFSNITLVEKMTKIELDGKEILMVPWIVDTGKFVSQFKKEKCDVCLGHFNIKGFNYNKFKTSDDGIKKSLFKKCGIVFSGHFHIRSKQNYGGGDIIYIGSPFQLTRNDVDEERGFVELDLNDLSYKHVNNEVSLKYIKLKYPEKFSRKTINGNIIDVHVDYDDSYDGNKIERYVKKIEEYQPVVTPNVFIDNNLELDGEIDLSGYNIGSVLDMISEYINKLEIKNKEDVYKTLVDLYEEAKGDI